MNPRRLSVAAVILPLLATSASAHRLDEYLQATMISVEKDRVQAVLRLTPGVAVSSFVLRGIDTNDDGMISPAERRAYAGRVLRDVSFSMNGHVLGTRLTSVEFPGTEDLRNGLGEIHIEFSVDLPRSGPNRRLIFANHHQSGIAAYLVNSLVPRDRDIRIVAQSRNEQQSFYQLDYVQARDSSNALLIIAALLLLARLAFLWRRPEVRIGCYSEGTAKASSTFPGMLF
jgi:hypothetical protein